MAELEVFPPAEWSESSEEPTQGQREEIERLVGEAYACLRLRNWGSYTRKVSELSLYPRGMVEDIIREKAGKVQPHRAAQLARIHEAVTAFPVRAASSSPQKKVPKEEVMRVFALRYARAKVPIPSTLRPILKTFDFKKVPELDYPIPILPKLEDQPINRQRVADYIDTEGSIGEVRRDRVDTYRWQYPEVSFGVSTRAMAEKFAQLTSRPVPRPLPYNEAVRYIFTPTGLLAITLMHYIRPYTLRFPDKIDALTRKYRSWFSVRL